LDTASPELFRRNGRAIGRIGVDHAFVRFFKVVLPPPLPLLRAEFGVPRPPLGVRVGVVYATRGLMLDMGSGARCSTSTPA
jgi:hypothetical protein